MVTSMISQSPPSHQMAASFKSNMPPKQSITAGMNVLFLLFLIIIFLFFHLSSIPGYGMGNSVWSQLLLFEKKWSN
jgi:hypothetical protein